MRGKRRAAGLVSLPRATATRNLNKPGSRLTTARALTSLRRTAALTHLRVFPLAAAAARKSR